jgi:UDP-N-acetylglucosamine--N-acetylmuramyl-(pentapeptide) pyrophosphoryl-undecaprenol N-acetylglucosamine transferase
LIFVTLGTHEQPFDRAIALLAEAGSADELYIQHGATPTRPDLIAATWVEYLEWSTLTATMRRAQVVVSHAGVGSMVTAIRAGKKPVVIPRLARWGEHVDDHQLQLALRLAKHDAVLVCGPEDSLGEVVALAREGRPAVRPSGLLGLRQAVFDAALGSRVSTDSSSGSSRDGLGR